MEKSVRVTAIVQKIMTDPEALDALVKALRELGVGHIEITLIEEGKADVSGSVEGALAFLKEHAS